jgi:hypothetical protein
MLPRLKLIQCFNCRNNIECWGLNEDIPLGKNEKESSIQCKGLSFLISRYMEDQNCNIGEQFGILSMGFLQTMRYDKESPKRDVYQMIFMLAALSNSANDSWVCPEEDEKDDANWSYEERKT